MTKITRIDYKFYKEFYKQHCLCIFYQSNYDNYRALYYDLNLSSRIEQHIDDLGFKPLFTSFGILFDEYDEALAIKLSLLGTDI